MKEVAVKKEYKPLKNWMYWIYFSFFGLLILLALFYLIAPIITGESSLGAFAITLAILFILLILSSPYFLASINKIKKNKIIDWSVRVGLLGLGFLIFMISLMLYARIMLARGGGDGYNSLEFGAVLRTTAVMPFFIGLSYLLIIIGIIKNWKDKRNISQ